MHGYLRRRRSTAQAARSTTSATTAPGREIVCRVCHMYPPKRDLTAMPALYACAMSTPAGASGRLPLKRDAATEMSVGCSILRWTPPPPVRLPISRGSPLGRAGAWASVPTGALQGDTRARPPVRTRRKITRSFLRSSMLVCYGCDGGYPRDAGGEVRVSITASGLASDDASDARRD